MILSHFQKKQLYAHQAESVEGLADIQKTDINLVYWKRPVNEDIFLYAKALLEHPFKGINTIVSTSTVRAVITEQLDHTKLHYAGKSMLADDIAQLSRMFMKIIKEDAVKLYLKVVDNDACSKFHTDRYDLRLLCTYIGCGTEWVEEPYVNRSMLMRGENSDIVTDASKVQMMQPFEVGILKGEASASNKNKGIVHRSPPVRSESDKRLLLRLDY